MSVSTFRLGSSYVLVKTGQPQDNTRIGFGDTVAEAYEDLQPTLMQSLGPDCGVQDTLEWALIQGWLNPGDIDALEKLDEEET